MLSINLTMINNGFIVGITTQTQRGPMNTNNYFSNAEQAVAEISKVATEAEEQYKNFVAEQTKSNQ